MVARREAEEMNGDSAVGGGDVVPGKKARKARIASRFVLVSVETDEENGRQAYLKLGDAKTIKAAWALAADMKAVGTLEVHCVRGRKVGEVTEAHVLK